MQEVYYPCNYGYIPKTLAEDGDPVDVMVVTPTPLISGSVIQCRPIALLRMTDDGGPDSKVLAAPITKLCKLYRHANGPDQIPEMLLKQIAHFFEHYKDLEEGKWVALDGWTDAAEAKREIVASRDRYEALEEKPNF